MTAQEVVDRHRDEYLGTIEGRIDWFGQEANKAQRWYNLSRTLLILLGVTTPVVATLAQGGAWSDLKYAVTVLSMATALIVGLDTQFKPGERWQHFRSAEMALTDMRQAHVHTWVLVADEKGRWESFQDFFDKCESFMRAEAGIFWQKLVPKSDGERG